MSPCMNNTVKNSVRHLICKVYDQFASNKDKVSVLSLPGTSWEFEKYVLNNYGFRNLFGSQLEMDLVCFERDHATYEYNVEERYDVLDNRNVSYINEHVEQAMEVYTQQENVFSWFDFCGQPSFFDLDYHRATGKQVQVFTFTTNWRRRENVPAAILEDAKKVSPAQAILNYFKPLMDERGYHLLFAIEYVGVKSPMLCFCITNDHDVLNHNYKVENMNAKKQASVVTQKTIIPKTNKQGIYEALKSGINESVIMVTYGINIHQLAAHKAWLTMWGQW